jgi:DNA primase
MNSPKTINRVIDFCHKSLLEDNRGLSYLQDSRNLDIEIIKEFSLGLFPQDIRVLFQVADPQILRKINIITNASHSVFKTWEIIFPVRDGFGVPVALAGRLIEANNKLSKYMNTPYQKKNYLFGLDLAKKTILKEDKVYVVEGYFDVIKAHQHNIKNVVGVCSSFLTRRQLSLLSRYTENIILMLDNDEPGKRNTQKILSRFENLNGVKMSHLNPFCSGTKDLDEFLDKYGPKKLILR